MSYVASSGLRSVGFALGLCLVLISSEARAAEIAGNIPEARRAEIATSKAFADLRASPTLLRAFLGKMPKGGDIHLHLSGAVYAESLIKWATDDGACVDPDAFKLVAPPCTGNTRQAADTLTDVSFYNRLIDAWSTRSFNHDVITGHDQFFNAFDKFGYITGRHAGDMLAEVASRAATENVSYLEVMLTLDGTAVRRLGAAINWDPDLKTMEDALLGADLLSHLKTASAELDDIESTMRARLGCQTARAEPGCGVTIRYIQQTTRTNPPNQVFAGLLFAARLSQADPRVVGLNLVGPEDNPVALRDYRTQMEMLDYLWKRQSTLKVALHAGELAFGLVPPEDLRSSHIRLAVDLGHALRIGHGVDIAYEEDTPGLWAELARRKILIEINLTSNDQILGVKGDDHPFPDYLRHGVPAAISTDDEGVARTDLTNEYVRAARSYKLDYRQLKTLARNSVAYGFLQGRDLWADVGKFDVVKDCRGDVPGTNTPSVSCRNFLAASEHARAEWRLERDFDLFERPYLNLRP